MTLKLIVESNYQNLDVSLDYLIEAQQSGQKTYCIQGPFVQCNKKNGNKRIYPLELMQQCIGSYVKERMNPNQGFRSFGELGHPEGVEINPDRISHYTKELQWHGDDCIGKAEILDTPMGRIVMTILDKKLRLATSTRGIGGLDDKENRDGSKNVIKYLMIASDIVIDPSAPQGFVEGILENKKFIIKDENQNQRIVECIDNMEQSVISLPRKSDFRKETFYQALKKFLNEI
jgi:hypothetical protein